MDVKDKILITVPSEEAQVIEKELEPKYKINNKPIYRFFKRLFDVVLSIIALIILALPMVLIALLIRIGSPGGSFYVHNRIGKNGKPLSLFKFRTMYSDADEMINSFTSEQKAELHENFKLENDPRITRFGKFLRRSSLDELPQLVNILKGELSIVGPRPIVTEELERYGENKDLFLSVTPGLTGYWQAYARSTCTYEERMEMELSYAENANFWWDIKIIFVTIGAVFRGRGAR